MSEVSSSSSSKDSFLDYRSSIFDTFNDQIKEDEPLTDKDGIYLEIGEQFLAL